jgi:dTDP-4-dehydrorhamnose reductase
MVHGVDLCDFDSTYKMITKLNPDIVIHCAAQSNVDECERNPKMAYMMNAIAARNVAIACQKFDSAMVYISTDYVFSGKNGPQNGYTEFDEPNPAGMYSITKLEGEKLVKEFLSKYYIIRTAWLYGHQRTNFVTQIAESLTNSKPTKQVEDMISSPTNVKDLANSVSFLIKTGCFGTYHITNTGWDSRYNVACYIADLLGTPRTLVQKCKLADLNLKSPRPAFSGLNHFVWELNGYKPLRNWKDAVKEFLTEKDFI